MHWYLVHTKPRQEKCALDNLQRQGYQCYLPTRPSEKLRQRLLTLADEPLFPRYLFIQLGMDDTGQELGAHPFDQGRQPSGQLRDRTGASG